MQSTSKALADSDRNVLQLFIPTHHLKNFQTMQVKLITSVLGRVIYGGRVGPIGSFSPSSKGVEIPRTGLLFLADRKT